MQAIAATAGLQIDQRQRQVVAAEEPREGARRGGLPFGMAIGALGRKTGRNRRRGFQRLLVKGARRLAFIAKAVRTDGRKTPVGAVCCVISQRKERTPASV